MNFKLRIKQYFCKHNFQTTYLDTIGYTVCEHEISCIKCKKVKSFYAYGSYQTDEPFLLKEWIHIKYSQIKSFFIKPKNDDDLPF